MAGRESSLVFDVDGATGEGVGVLADELVEGEGDWLQEVEVGGGEEVEGVKKDGRGEAGGVEWVRERGLTSWLSRRGGGSVVRDNEQRDKERHTAHLNCQLPLSDISFIARPPPPK